LTAVAKPTPRGWRLVKVSDAAQIDGAIALAMAAERAAQTAYKPRFIGWARMARAGHPGDGIPSISSDQGANRHGYADRRPRCAGRHD
jgi:hypothetical protein